MVSITIWSLQALGAAHSLMGGDIKHWKPRKIFEKLGNWEKWIGQGNWQDPKVVGFLDIPHVFLGGTYGTILKSMGYGHQDAMIYTTFYGFLLFESTIEAYVPWEYGDLLSDLYGVMSVYP